MSVQVEAKDVLSIVSFLSGAGTSLLAALLTYRRELENRARKSYAAERDFAELSARVSHLEESNEEMRRAIGRIEDCVVRGECERERE